MFFDVFYKNEKKQNTAAVSGRKLNLVILLNHTLIWLFLMQNASHLDNQFNWINAADSKFNVFRMHYLNYWHESVNFKLIPFQNKHLTEIQWLLYSI